MMKRLLTFYLSFIFLFAAAQRRATVSGYILDQESRETLIGAHVVNAESHAATATNAFGHYSLTLPAGTAELLFSYPGYAPQRLHLDLNADTLLNVSLTSTLHLGEATVRAQRSETGPLAIGMGAITIPVEQIEHTPSLLGETDALKTIQLQAGVQQGFSGSAGLYVRGSSADENLFLLDDVPVYKVEHLFGFFSVFTPEAMKQVTFYKGSYPARYTGRLASIVDVRTRDGDMQHFHGSASLGALSSRLHLEGPLWKDHTSYSLSARRTYFDLLTKPFMQDDDKFGYYFYDLNAKLNHRFSDSDRLYLSFYGGRDQFSYSGKDEWGGSSSQGQNLERYGSSLHWGNTLASLRWNHAFGDRLFANTTLAYNRYRMSLGTWDEEKFAGEKKWARTTAAYFSHISDWSAATDFDWNPGSAAHHVRFGGKYIYHHFAPEYTRTETTDSLYASPHRNYYAHELSLYASDDWRISSQWQASVGLAYGLFAVEGRNYGSLQPRLSLRYQPAAGWAVKAAATRMQQYIHLLTSMPIAMPTDIWVPITRRVRPMDARQLSLGVYCTRIEGWQFSVEAYAKNLRNVLEYKDGMSFFGFSDTWEDLVGMGRGRARGLEFTIERTAGRTTGSLSYTLARSTRKFSRESGVNDGKRFPFMYDRRHTLNLLLNHSFSQRFDLDASWQFQSGAAATLATQSGYILRPGEGEREAAYVPSRNNYRLPVSHTLSLGANLRRVLKGGVRRTWNLSVYNLYNAMNPTILYRSDAQDSSRVRLTKFTLLPIIPSFSLKYEF